MTDMGYGDPASPVAPPVAPPPPAAVPTSADLRHAVWVLMTLPEHLRDGLLSLVGTGGPKEYAHFPPGQPPELYLFPAPKDAGDLPDDDERAGRPVEPQSAAARG